jgi:hydrogenase maturation protease
MTILVIACGSSIRSDDALGPIAADILTRRVIGLPVEVLSVHQLTPELSEPLASAEFAVFIDADTQGEPGTVTMRSVYPEKASEIFTHQMTPGALLSASQVLYGRAPAAVLFTLTGENFEIGETLSATVVRALPGLIESVTQLIFDAVLPTGN